MSPIFITEYTWSQNISDVHIKLPLRNVHLSKVNVITLEKLLKVNFPPYLFQIVLHNKIDQTKTKCILKDDMVVVELKKLEPRYWDSLNEQIDRNDFVECEKKLILQEHEKVAKESKLKSNEKQKRKQTVNAYQIDLIQEEKRVIQEVKDQAKLKAFQELAEIKNNNVLEKETVANSTPTTTYRYKDSHLPVPILLPRRDGVIKFNLSKRVFPTPKRVSKKTEEDEWLKKESEAMRATGFVSDDLKEDEKNPIWLLNKGMSFMKKENYLGAVNAFSYGVKISPKMPILYLRLAQAQLNLQHYCKTIENCTKALELLTPVVDKNKPMRIEAYQTRGAAYKYINEFDLSSADHEFADSLK